MVLGDSIVFHADGSLSVVMPRDGKFTEGELRELVGGPFFVVSTNKRDKCFVFGQHTSEADYNINANYLLRRSVEDIMVLRGQVLLCRCELIEAAVISQYNKPVTEREADAEVAE